MAASVVLRAGINYIDPERSVSERVRRSAEGAGRALPVALTILQGM